MQDRYAGDIGDFGKMGLLKAIQAQGLSVGVNWYRVESMDIEKKADGSFKQEDGKYLVPAELRVCDEALAETLTRIAESDSRSINALERENLIPNACYYDTTVTVAGRVEWHDMALKILQDADVVFLDPDNGMLVDSVGKSTAKSIKYAFYEEVADYFRRGQSVLIYNHRSRKQEAQYFHEICSKLQEVTGVPENDILKITFPKCSVRDYLAVPASMEHREKLEAAFMGMEQGTWGKMGMCRT
jgi:hypothetical protein